MTIELIYSLSHHHINDWDRLIFENKPWTRKNPKNESKRPITRYYIQTLNSIRRGSLMDKSPKPFINNNSSSSNNLE